METIKSINTTAELRIALDLHDVPADKLHERFKEIADALLTKFAIQKGDQLFYITDIEFYYYTNDHKDFITYPRKCHAGEWFFHSSGVDIAFESNINFEFVNKKKSDKYKQYKPVLNSTAEFGGILIRSIIPANGATFEGDAERLIDHPLNVSDFLFDHFDALKSDNRYPVLVECTSPHREVKSPEIRDIKALQDRNGTEKKIEREKKFENIKKYNYARIDDEVLNDNLERDFNDYLTKKLRYKSI